MCCKCDFLSSTVRNPGLSGPVFMRGSAYRSRSKVAEKGYLQHFPIAHSWSLFLMLENGQLMAKCDIFHGDLFVTTADENQESNCHEKLVQHAAMSVRTSDKRINRLIILWDFGEAQLWDLLWWFFGPLTILPLW